MGELYICCLEAEPGDLNFGTLEIKDRMGCDFTEFAGLYCDISTDPCLVEGATCPDGGGICTAVYNCFAGASSFDTGTIRLPFKKTQSGDIDFSISVEAIGCTSVCAGSGSSPAVTGDEIKVDIDFSIATEQSGCSVLTPTATPVLTNMTGGSGVYTSTGDAIAGMSCSFDYSTSFSDSGWLGAVQLAVIEFRVRVRGYHSGSPGAFCIAHPSAGYAVIITGSVAGTCCEATLFISIVDP